MSFDPRFASTHSIVASAIGGGALGHQVENVVRPVLDRGVAATATFLHHDLDHCRVERVGGVDRRRAAFDVVDESTFVDDDQRALELPHVLGVDPEVGLQAADRHGPPAAHR